MSTDDPFRGKVVSVWVKSAAQGCVMQGLEVRRLGGREFVVGRLADPGPGVGTRPLLVGNAYWFPLDDVIQLLVFDNLEAAWAAYARTGPPPVTPPGTG